MRFAEAWWLAGTAGALVLAAFLVLGAVLLVRSLRRFGQDDRMAELVTDRAGGRRAFKAVLLVLAVALAFVALARPQYGRGTRRIPKTNLDVIVALDYSKSMYARDVPPSRIERAKAEVGELIERLPGARFGAVAFAGEPLSFPLTSDGSAIAQFFRQLSPNDMPVGGTAIARALAAADQLLKRDPLSKKHRRVIVLVTDGEDLEGDPVSVAESAGESGITIHVVQIGGRTPEPIPAIDESGAMAGYRKSRRGEVLTTSLSAEGEKQLAEIASSTGGNVVRSARGTTGISEITKSLSHMMTAELSERVETVYADVYMYPAGAAVLLLLLEAFVPETRRRRKPKKEGAESTSEPEPPPRGTPSPRRRADKTPARVTTALLLLIVLGGCSETVDKVFTRHSPVVDNAIRALDAGDASAATHLLGDYLNTGHCKNGEIDTPDKVRELFNASLDLGLALFEIGERFGAPFGQSSPPGIPGAPPPDTAASRSAEIDCALSIVRLIATDRKVPFAVRARAHYLSGNLEFLREHYEDAVTAYDSALRLVPGTQSDAGDDLGRQAAYNRAIALRRIEERKNEPDAGPPPERDGGEPQPGDGGNEQPPNPDGGQRDNQGDGGGGPKSDEESPDGGAPEQKPPDEPESGDGGAKTPQPEPRKPPPKPSLSQDERMLDQLEHAPTLQQAAKKPRRRVPFVGMEDK